MYKSILFIAALFLISCKATIYYVVRHAEKATATTMANTSMTSDVPLSEAGKQRAEALKTMLQKENVRHIFSTNYIRTKTTAQPLAEAINVPVEIYDPKDSAFMTKLKSLNGNILIVGHSNTVDDLVNELSGKKEISGDLPDSEYGDLFIVKKKGSKVSFEKKHFGQ
ncbi:MAG TPA: phosphoglycerate mutase family protein [Flavisolibacter sp.]|jgi:broad specificity phosphatase PhoE|nr:phosphoglycerate mutase family protein [Flavisolibacter sp.]